MENVYMSRSLACIVMQPIMMLYLAPLTLLIFSKRNFINCVSRNL